MEKLSIHLKTIVSRSVQLLSMMVFVPLLIASSCSESFDDSALWDSLNSLEERISAMETVMAAYKNKLLINSITETDNGYIITFSDGSQATITLTDWGFKRLFGRVENVKILTDFLKALFPEKRIASLRYNNTENTGRMPESRKSVFDVTCTSEDGGTMN